MTPGHEPKLWGHLEHLHLDFVALLSVIVNIFLITEYCLFSDWLESFPFCKVTILIVAKQPLDSVFPTWVILINLSSFRGTHVAATVIKGPCKALPVTQKPHWSYHHQFSEKPGWTNDPLKPKLAKLSEHLQLLWSKVLLLAPLANRLIVIGICRLCPRGLAIGSPHIWE